MTYHNSPNTYPSPERDLRVALIPLRNALVLSGALVCGLAVGGYGF